MRHAVHAGHHNTSLTVLNTFSESLEVISVWLKTKKLTKLPAVWNFK